MEEKVLLNVEGMDCANCALSITRSLQKSGFQDVNVNFATGEVVFDIVESKKVDLAVSNIKNLGYLVVDRSDLIQNTEEVKITTNSFDETRKKFLISLVFTLPLFLHMFVGIAILHNPYFQLICSLPVLFIGITHFGKSAYYSIKSGVPNMDVLIVIGSTAAFAYSILGMILQPDQAANFLFFETGATIITLVLLGNMIEQRSVKQTTSALRELSSLQPSKAKIISNENGIETLSEIEIEKIKLDDTLIFNTGDRIAVDGIIITGNGIADESMLTGESMPVTKKSGDNVIGGTLVIDGSFRIKAEKTTKDSALAKIISLVKIAQNNKPEIQKLGDRISAIFVPVVLLISLTTFLSAAYIFDLPFSKALLNSIAVLVISCPCAMGLATPTAVIAGIGRAAKSGILIKGGSTLEQLAKVKTIIFDKTGTLTTGNFKIKKISSLGLSEEEIQSILYSLESHSSHPIARSIHKELSSLSVNEIKWKTIQEDKGIGINATTESGDLYSAGSFQMVKHFFSDDTHNIYVLKNNKLIATVDIEDELKPGSRQMIDRLKAMGIKSVLLSGDKKNRCIEIAEQCGIEEFYFEKLPNEKSKIIAEHMKSNPTAMIGDGINDAPALAMATVGISISNASDVAIQSAQVILLDKKDISILLKAITISRLTYSTIKQNLFWAFFYNTVAIPFAAFGFLSPMIGALSMAFSDVIVIGNSLRLKTRKIF
ncbi:MAG: cadmium-translocating P-type ATPase [Bacteroidia bacterium]|nr:cadmium-translocating P-type ATPase [Bacteroidia bacterium]